MVKTLRDVAKVLYEVEGSLSCKICVRCKEKEDNHDLSCVDCIEDGITKLFDRATPKKPKQDLKSPIRYVKTYECPNCHNKFTGSVSIFCYHCGQAIDWSEEQ